MFELLFGLLFSSLIFWIVGYTRFIEWYAAVIRFVARIFFSISMILFVVFLVLAIFGYAD